MSAPPQPGHNSNGLNDQIKELIVAYVKCDEESAILNDKRKEIREQVEAIGQDSKAFQDEISRVKKDRKKKEGYDESRDVIRAAIGSMDQDDLFSYIDARDRKKEEAREAKQKEREANSKKDDSFKPAPDRKPKTVDAATATKEIWDKEKAGKAVVN